MHETLHKALRQAVRWGYMVKNPADDVDPPRVHTQEITPLAREEARRLLNTVQGDRLEALYFVALHTGLRQVELPPLHWEDLDLKACTLQVHRTVTKDGSKLQQNRAESKDGKAHAGRHVRPKGT
jgi:integrase